ncbi:NACHT domain-containing protein [Sunxiuqinia elliptica]|uniref:NACHT domain-containing protein n=1 Tax=Sunxiuqinia elliptica TaxID=655355 RepID=A0A1I2K3T9_9BACT|nr:NACHT domain-containing protein [Sunxiuqinia elliptica]SFF60840.1 NACHT domain-containing protein [Sunxiuqinia elliptica]
MKSISWHQLEQNSSSKELSFESFCFQIATKKYKDYGTFESFYNTPGSEFYLELSKDCNELNAKAGDIIGWQAKFWLNKKDDDNSPLDVTHRNELVQGLKKSLEYKNNLTHWIICTPGKFSNTKTKAGKPWDLLVKECNQIKKSVNLSHWHKDIFEAIFHSNPEGFSSIFNLYFNTKLIGKEFLNSLTRANLRQLERKFDVDLHIKEDGELNLLNSIYPDKARADVNIYIKLLDDVIDDINRDYRIKTDQFNDLTSEFVKLTRDFYSKHIEILNEINSIYKETIDIYVFAKKSKTAIDNFIQNSEIERDQLNKHLKEIFKKSDNNDINYQDVDWLEFMIQNVNNISDLLIGRRKDNSLLKIILRILSNDVHVFGAAGYGKTHFACSISYNLLKNEYPALLLLGSSFRNSVTPKERIIQLLDLDGSYSFKDFLGAIDILGEIYKCKVPIIIDGLNESYPSAGEIWHSELYSIINDVRKYSNILLITTCREKRDYIQQIFNKESYKEVDNFVYLKGFTDKNINSAVEKYFEKYSIKPSSKPYDITLFENPLRLKIFCEVNKDRSNLDINLYSIIESIESYILNLIKKISTKEHAVNAIRKSKLEKGLQEIGEILWNNNKREIQFSDFYPLFEEELSFNLIDEGLCFQRDINNEDELIQFTYDLVGGYQIAKSVFFKNKSIPLIIEQLQSAETKEKLFCDDKTKRHPLHEDILKSISYLLPLKTRKQIYEVLPEESILLESIGNIELLTSNENDKIKFVKFLDSLSLSSELVNSLFQRLYDDIAQRNTFNSFDIITTVFLKLSPYEIDMFWNELIRKDSYKLQSILKSIIKNSQNTRYSKDNVLLFVLLLTGSTDKKLRNEATKVLMHLGVIYPNCILRLAQTFILANDIFILESLICALTGVVLRLKEKHFTKNVVNFLQRDFLVKNSTNHIAILDYLQTIFEFGFSYYGIEYDKNIINRNKDEVWVLNKELIRKDKGDDFFWSYEMMDYDFIKFQIVSLSEHSYGSISKYSRAEIISFISERIKQNGYDKDLYNPLEEKIAEDNKYRREEASEQVIKYGEKYLYYTYLELAGFLMLNNQIKPEYKNTLRFSYVFFDPTFPVVKNRTQVINDCFLPAFNEDIQNWVLKDPSPLLHRLYITIPYFENSEMVLIYASLNQKDDDSKTYITVHINTYLFESKLKKDISETFQSSYVHESDGFSQIFGGEIPWRSHVENDEEIEDFEDEDGFEYEGDDDFDDNFESPNKTNNQAAILLSSDCYYPLVNKYSWSSWTRDRFQNPSFVFLDSIIANKMELVFNVDELSHINKNGKFITKYYKTDNSEFLFIDRQVLEKYMSDNSLDLVWNKFIAKYGEFGVYQDNKLDPSYKDTKSIDFYSDYTP